ncbi:MAG: hypothetical protein QXW94_06045 [Desulfurococcaceae archaeon]
MAVEVENEGCRVLRDLKPRELSNINVVDVRPSKAGLVKHLVLLGGEKPKHGGSKGRF